MSRLNTGINIRSTGNVLVDIGTEKHTYTHIHTEREREREREKERGGGECASIIDLKDIMLKII